MKSTWLLLWSFRRVLFVAMAVEFPLGLLSGQAVRPAQENVDFLLLFLEGGMFVLALMFVLFGDLPRRLYMSPFPVTARQKTWIPMACEGLVWASGLAGMAMGILHHAMTYAVPLSSWWPLLSQSAQVLLVAAFIVALLHNPAVGKEVLILGYVATVVLYGLHDASDLPKLYAYATCWPPILVITAFYFLAAPAATALRDRSRFASEKTFPNLQVESERCSRPTPTMVIAETGAAVGHVVICAAGLALLYAGLLVAKRHTTLGLYSALWVLSIGLMGTCLLLVVGNDYRRIRASGFSQSASLALLAMRATLLLVPVSRALGVRQGGTKPCPQCGAPVFVWAPQCRQCAPLCDTTASVAQVETVATRRVYTGDMSGRTAGLHYFMLIVIGTLAVSPGYHQELRYSCPELVVTFPKYATPTRPEEVARLKHELRAEAEAWVESACQWPMPEEHIPKKFTMRASIADTNEFPSSPGSISFAVSFKCWTPQWESPGALAGALVRHLYEKLKGHYIVRAEESHTEDGGHVTLSLLQRVTLDNQLHWEDTEP